MTIEEEMNLPCYQFSETHNKVFEESMNLDLIRELERKEGEVTEEDFCITPGETVKLPPKHLKFRYLHIPHSCKIVGSPETVLEITGGIFIGTFKNPTSGWDTVTSLAGEPTAVHF